MTKTIKISGMHCQHCVVAVTQALQEIAGVTKVEVSLENAQAVVEAEGVTDAALTEAVEDIGFDVEEVK